MDALAVVRFAVVITVVGFFALAAGLPPAAAAVLPVKEEAEAKEVAFSMSELIFAVGPALSVVTAEEESV